MSSTITIIDYGVGNLLNVVRAFEHFGADVIVADTEKAIASAGHLVLPGVGAFSDSMKELNDRGLAAPIMEHAQSGKPLLGICLGMQMLMDESEEFGNWPGLGLIHGKVVEIPKTGLDEVPHKIPHIGWNELIAPKGISWKGSILHSINQNSTVYFVHSFMVETELDSQHLADCNYDGRKICAAIQHENIIGCQFHPEKSGNIGLQIIRNFTEL